MQAGQDVKIISGAPEGFDASLILKEFNSGNTLIHVARDDKRLASLKSDLKFYSPNLSVLEFPSWDCLPFDRVSPTPNIAATRISTLANLSRGFVRPQLILTTVNAVIQRVPPRSIIDSTVFLLKAGVHLNESKLITYLLSMGFSKTPTVLEVGEFAVRGGLIDVFPPGDQFPIRLDLFGDTLETIRRFDHTTQLTIKNIESVKLTSASEVVFSEASISLFRQNYRAEFGVSGQQDPLYESVSSGIKYQGMEHWLPFFYERMDSIFDYIPLATVSFDENVEPLVEERWTRVSEQYESRLSTIEIEKQSKSNYKPLPPGLLYFNYLTLLEGISKQRVLSFATVPKPLGLGVVDSGGRLGRNFSPERQLRDGNIFNSLVQYISTFKEIKPVILACFTEGSRERLVGLLKEAGLFSIKDINSLHDVGSKYGIFGVVWPLEQGFEANDHVVISEQDVLGAKLIQGFRKRRKSKNFISELQSLNIEDLVIHSDHGLGRFLGLKTINAVGAPHECIELEYMGGDKLFLPVENIELLSKYGQEVGIVDKLGGSSWQSKKTKLKKRIKDMAERLIKVAAERELKTAPILEVDVDMWGNFCSRFPYNETEDQLDTIDTILSDLKRGMPMDRLICGDVGFGKTEVAMRAAFVVASAGYQVAIVVPTTLLSRQHTISFINRFRGFPINIRQLSRFVSLKDAKNTKSEISTGTVDIVVGTHALISDQIKFKKLGLLIVDEEQHFGVQHKEKLKQLRSDIHVLTLSATPIPRTLQLSLSGIRELSIIETPPVDRLAIRTYVTEFDPLTIREALLREYYRGGQSFFVVPRVSDIPEVSDFLSLNVPEVTFTVAHGQLPAAELDKRMNDFYDSKFNILISTSIVESGLDVPTANTIVVHRADMFGLSQLYQIRGRVGRSKVRAYAYLTTKPKVKLTSTAQKRLRVLGSIDSLGAGFNIASQDMDIRGAGNILGEEQSGNVREVGYELYQAMLQETVAKIKAGELGIELDNDQWSPNISLGVPVLIPENYIPDLDVRLGLYKRLADLSDKVELEGFAAELIDRFGPLPKAVSTLILVIRIKAMCKRAGIFKFNAGPKGGTIEFYKNKFSRPIGLADFISEQGGLAIMRDNKLIVKRTWKTSADKIKGSFAIVRDLAVKAQA